MAYVYTHTRLDTNEIFYVGIGIGNDKKYKRAKETYSRTSLWKNIVSKAKRTVEIVADNITWEEACEIEIYLIMFFGRRDLHRGNLVNLTNGGEGTLGFVRSQEHSEKLRLSHVGRKCSNETKLRISTSNKGKKVPREIVEKIRLKNIGRIPTDEARENMRKSATGRKHTEDAKKKMRGRIRSQKHIDNLILSANKKEVKEKIQLAMARGRKARMVSLGQLNLLF